MTAIIDVHTHYLPTAYTAALKQHIAGDPDGWPTPAWTPATTLKFMQKVDCKFNPNFLTNWSA
ncbi:hypothetical protein LFAB_07320 [Lactiplantibacillus fabifermentans T30PCM01]|uniref:Amidohydrolase n=1 Tax=Lactiplantibacillus fabifermentans T30PCM01 TaxID=1400520 RepID=W6T833_9LACO|nr:hypothetical protein LFAB_07320 [Lactiplantibacillus fabifermentans T30PCM01]